MHELKCKPSKTIFTICTRTKIFCHCKRFKTYLLVNLSNRVVLSVLKTKTTSNHLSGKNSEL